MKKAEVKKAEVKKAENSPSELLREIELQGNLLALSAALGAASQASPEDRMALVAAELRHLAEAAKAKEWPADRDAAKP